MIGSGLTLVTGLPGSGKTAMIVDMMTRIQGRPLFCMGVTDLKIPHEPCPPVADWTELRPDPDDPSLLVSMFTFPPNSIVVLDEAQTVYRPRPAGSKVPEIVQAFEKRRHTGVDFVLMTQDATLIDANVRKLVNTHIHIYVTMFGSYKLQWLGAKDPSSVSDRALAVRTKYKPPKAAFKLYKSSELHTKVIVRRPWFIYAAPFFIAALVWGGFHIYGRIQAKLHPETVAVGGQDRPVGGGVGQIRPGGGQPLTSAEYLAQQEPRILGLPHTAPAYDQLTIAKVVPEPAGCFESKRTGCKCVTQQGTPYLTTDIICRQILATGLWMPWKAEVSAAEESRDRGRGVDRASSSEKSVLNENEMGPRTSILPADKPRTLSASPKA